VLMRALHANPKQFESMSSMARQAMEVWLSPKVLQSADASRPNFDVRDFLSGPNTIYVVAPGEAMQQVAPLNVAVVMEIWRTLNIMAASGEKMPTQTLLFVFDEMANICPLPDFDKLISTTRGLGIRIMSLWQDVGQIKKLYGENVAGTLINNHQCRVALAANADRQTAEYFVALAGSQRVDTVSTSVGGGQRSQSIGQATEQLLDVGSFRMLDDNQALCLVGSSPPFYVEQRPYYRDTRLKAMTEEPYFEGVEHLRQLPEVAGAGRAQSWWRTPLSQVLRTVRRTP